MRVRPHELANVCALFPSLRTGRISVRHLRSYVQKTLSIDSLADPGAIISECIGVGLIEAKPEDFVLTGNGRELARQHNVVSSTLSPAARDLLLKSVYLNPHVASNGCGILTNCVVDPTRKTFVYQRSEDDPYEVTTALQHLNTLGFLEVFPELAIVRTEYLGLANAVLAALRGVEGDRPEILADSETDEVGNLAEEQAVIDEQSRLNRVGHTALAKLVHRISLVDRTAGYDVISYAGEGAQPESEIYIEVKGTRSSKVGFVWTRNEMAVARIKGPAYWIYVYRNVDLVAGMANGPLRISDPINSLSNLGYTLDPLDVYVTSPLS